MPRIRRQYEDDNVLESLVFKLSHTVTAGYGLELLCKFQFDGDKFSCDWLKRDLKKDITKEKFPLYYINC